MLSPLIQSNPFLKFTTMLDSGATKCFIDDSFVSTHKLTTHPLEHETRIVTADGRVVVASRGCTIRLLFDNYSATTTFIVTKLHDKFDAVLVLDFIKTHNPHIDWETNTLTLSGNKQLRCTGQP